MIKISYGTQRPERDSAFLLNGKAFKYSLKALMLNCEAVPINMPKEYQIDLQISSESLEIFINALEKDEIDIDPRYIADLYCLCQKFNFSRLLSMINNYFATDEKESIIIDQLIISSNNGMETASIEEEILRSITNIIKCPTFFSLPPQIMTRIIRKAQLPSNNILEIIMKLKELGKSMENYLELYSQVRFDDISLENREFMLQECQDTAVNIALSNYMKDVINNQQVIDRSQNIQIQAQNISLLAQIEELKSEISRISDKLIFVQSSISTNANSISNINQTIENNRIELSKQIGDIRVENSNDISSLRSEVSKLYKNSKRTQIAIGSIEKLHRSRTYYVKTLSDINARCFYEEDFLD